MCSHGRRATPIKLADNFSRALLRPGGQVTVAEEDGKAGSPGRDPPAGIDTCFFVILREGRGF